MIGLDPNRTRNYLPFGYKLMLSYFVFIIIPVLLVGYVANSIFVKSIREQTRSNIQGTLQQMKDNILYKMEDTKRISDMLYYDNTLASRIHHYEEGWVSYDSVTKYMIPKFHSTIEATNRKLWLSIYLHNDTLPEIYNEYDHTDPLYVKSRLFDLYHIDRIEDKDWYKEHPEERYGETLVWQQIEDDASFGRISLLRRLVNIDNQFRVMESGFIRISIYLSDLFESVDYKKIGEGTMISVETGQAARLAFSGAEDRDEGGESLIIKEFLPELDAELVAFVPTSIIERDTQKVRMLTFVICGVCFIVFFFVGIFISRYFAKRVSKIVSVLDSFQEGEFHKRIHFKGRDEFTRISLALNEMGQNIGELIRKVYMTDLQKKEAELESLQSQINPHFLYNTLSSISRLAKFGEVDKLQQMVIDLAKFYRLSLNEGRTFIPVANELEQAKAYIAIQKTKYEDRMQVSMELDPQINKYETVKLILQPFIENVLEHAWCGDRVYMRIIGELKGGDIEFRIIDDGIGFRREILEQIFHPIGQLNVGYGIRNVDQRIKLHYGKPYGVTIFSRPGMGTAVKIKIPAK